VLARAWLQKCEFIELDFIQAHLLEGLLHQILQVTQRDQHKAVNAVEQINPRVIVQVVNQIRRKNKGQHVERDQEVGRHAG
jgi:hypothetical protein